MSCAWTWPAGGKANGWQYKGDYSFGLYLADAAALLARVTAPAQASRIRRMLGGSHRPPRRHVDWVGTSMGGLMGMMLAAKRHSPIRRLVLNDVGPLVPWPALVRMKQAYSGAHVSFATVDDAEAYLREACASFGPLSDAQWRRVAQHSTIRKAAGTYILAFDPAIITHMRGGAWRASSSAASSYTASIFGQLTMRSAARRWCCVARSPTCCQQITAREMTRRGPKAELVEFAGVGHAPWLMAEDQIKVVRDFLLAEPAKAPAVNPAPARLRGLAAWGTLPARRVRIRPKCRSGMPAVSDGYRRINLPCCSARPPKGFFNIEVI